jgi:hypothetical protein
VVDAGDGRYGLGSSGIHHQAVTLTLHALRLLLTDITHLCVVLLSIAMILLCSTQGCPSLSSRVCRWSSLMSTPLGKHCVKAYVEG